MERVAVNLSDAFHEAGKSTHLIYLKNRKREVEPRNKAIPVHLFNLKKGVFQTGIGIVWFALCKLLNIVFRKTFPLWFAYAESMVFKQHLHKLEAKNGKFDLIVFRGQGTFEHLWPLQDDRFVYVCENIQKKNMYGALSQWIFTKLFSKRNVACVSDGALSSFLDMAATHNIEARKAITISNPNNFDKIRHDAEQVTEPLHHKPYVLGLGRIVAQKNFTLLVEAYAHAVQHFNLTHDLIIVGAGKDKGNVEEKVKQLGLTSRVHFKGQQNNPFPWYKQADLFVLSSKFEGLGMVLLESLACNTIVVSTDSQGGVRQIMNGDLEVFLAKEEPIALAEKMQLALNAKWEGALATHIEKTLKRFSGSFIINQYIKEFG